MHVRSSVFHFVLEVGVVVFDHVVVGIVLDVAVVGIALIVVGIVVGVAVVGIAVVGVEIEIAVVVGVGVGEVGFVSSDVLDVVGTFVVEHALEVGEFRMVLGRIAVLVVELVVVGVLRFVDVAFRLYIVEIRFLLFYSCLLLGVV